MPSPAAFATRAPTAATAVRTLACAVALSTAAGTATAVPPGYALDPVHTRVLVAVGHAGFSKALGTVSGSQGWLLFDPDDWSQARLDVRVPLAQLDFGDEDWNRAVAGSALLDTARHPEARFVSTTVTGHDPNHATVCGELSLRGQVRRQCLEVTLNTLARHPLPPFRRTVGFSARGVLSRADFGIDAWRSVIGDEVELRIEAEAVRDSGAVAALDPVTDEAAGTGAADVTHDTANTYPSLEAAAEAALEQAAPASDASPPDPAGTTSCDRNHDDEPTP
ncbi:hypothetical protein C9I47_0797 [Lysobacter maris]|uniref:Lipid/polyisoprenoid-binding YceI-like domain-containing protein n=1 Tax=Marilutibacter maris TaxID=1605891 RepID=A0A2U9T7N5_9GAMM|nr:YceI family protein [Lysobacter maris]AWV06518.1 hypothetical protein C9I47_0797 [Lysobacter maris]